MAKAKTPTRFEWKEIHSTLTVIGKDKVTGDSIEFNRSDVSRENLPYLDCFALKTILSTRVSQADPDDKMEQMRDVIALLKTPKWTKEREGGGIAIVSTFVQAVAKVKGCTIPQAQQSLKSFDKEAKDKMRKNAKVVKAMRDIEAAQTKEAEDLVDLDDLAS